MMHRNEKLFKQEYNKMKQKKEVKVALARMNKMKKILNKNQRK